MDVITKNIARGLIKSMGPEKIGEMAASLLTEITERKNIIPLQEGENDIVALVYSINGIAYFAQCGIKEMENGNTEICRFIEVTPITEMLQNMLQNI